MSLTLETMAAKFLALEARVESLEKAKPAAASGPAPKVDTSAIADDADLDSKYGDPRIKYGLKEKYWKEQPDPHIGMAFSECPPEYLDATAKYLSACEYMARKEGGEANEKKARYKALDAARARGWSNRNRERGVTATADETADFENGADPEIPF